MSEDVGYGLKNNNDCYIQEERPDAAGLVTVSADSDEDQAMENELVASKLDCNHDDQLEVESPGRAEVCSYYKLRY